MRSDREHLLSLLRRIDGRGYPAYKDIRGQYGFDGFDLLIDHVQGDPFAAPSRVRVRVPMSAAGFAGDTRSPRIRYRPSLPVALLPQSRRFRLDLPTLDESGKNKRGSADLKGNIAWVFLPLLSG